MTSEHDSPDWKTRVTDYINNEKTPLAVCVGAFAVLMTASVVSGCQVEDFIKVKVPNGVQGAIETEPKITVAESDAAWDDWVAWVERNSRQFAESIDDGKQAADVIRSLTETGIAIGQDAAATLPGGALISTGLALVGGLFLRRPGDAKRTAKEKEASYNAGLDKGRDLLAQTVSKNLLERKNPDE
jgi:hypothetical protein